MQDSLLPKIIRLVEIKGYSIPGLINNLHYHFVDLSIYEDGRIECWNFEDFEHFKKDVERDWVSASIPNGEMISINGLGQWEIENGKWKFTKESFIKYVFSLVRKLNPKLENLYQYSPKTVNGVRIGENGKGILYKEENRTKKVKGRKINVFYQPQEDGLIYLISLEFYSKDSIIISRYTEKIEIDIEELEHLISQKKLLSNPPLKSRVEINNLGSFEVANCSYHTNIEDKFLEIKGIIRTIEGKPSLIETCIKAHLEFRANPTLKLKKALKEAYENIPKHQRRYVGDMDTKDIPIRMIIYGEQEIENWSHYQASKKTGRKLPSIKIPKIKEEE